MPAALFVTPPTQRAKPNGKLLVFLQHPFAEYFVNLFPGRTTVHQVLPQRTIRFDQIFRSARHGQDEMGAPARPEGMAADAGGKTGEFRVHAFSKVAFRFLMTASADVANVAKTGRPGPMIAVARRARWHPHVCVFK